MLELSERQASAIETERNVHSVSRGTGKFHKPSHQKQLTQNSKKGQQATPKARSRDNAATLCRNCGYEFPHIRAPCPAKGKTCNLCKNFNHFARCCRSHQKKVNEVTNSELQSGSEDEYNCNIEVKSVCNSKSPKTEILLNNSRIKATIDTGSSVNIIDEKAFVAMGKPRLQTKHLPSTSHSL